MPPCAAHVRLCRQHWSIEAGTRSSAPSLPIGGFAPKEGSEYPSNDQRINKKKYAPQNKSGWNNFYRGIPSCQGEVLNFILPPQEPQQPGGDVFFGVGLGWLGWVGLGWVSLGWFVWLVGWVGWLVGWLVGWASARDQLMVSGEAHLEMPGIGLTSTFKAAT